VKEVTVIRFPLCDFCGQTAGYDGKTKYGSPGGDSWAFMCERHFQEQGVGLGVGRGQKLVLAKKKEVRDGQ